MWSGYLKKTCVWVVLFAHLMQIFTPAVQASDTDYQYRVHVRTLNLETEKYQVEVSRRKKDKSEAVQIVRRLDLEHGQMMDHFIRSAPDGQEVLFGKFKDAVVKTYAPDSDLRFVYDLPGLGQIQVRRGGKVLLTQADGETSLAEYDLVVKSTGDLTIDRLMVAGLVLRSKMTELDGLVSADNLRLKHKALNKGKLETLRIEGSGEILNRGHLQSFGVDKAFELDKSKIFNQGRWDHEGDLDLKTQAGGISNANGAIINFIKGTVSFSSSSLWNFGRWTFDRLVAHQATLNNQHQAEMFIFGGAALTEATVRNHAQLTTGDPQRPDGVFSLEKGVIENLGSWDHAGHMALDGSVTNKGNISWKNGKFLAQASLANEGNWLIEGMQQQQPVAQAASQQEPKADENPRLAKLRNKRAAKAAGREILELNNIGTFQLKSSQLHFQDLVNRKLLLLFSGAYKADRYQGLGILRLLDNNWTLTDEMSSPGKPSALIKASPNHLFVPMGARMGEIEVQKDLIYDVASHFDKLKAEGKVRLHHRHDRPLEILKRITCSNIVEMWYKPGKDDVIDLELPNIAHLWLTFSGPVPVSRVDKLIVPALKLKSYSPLTIGASNEKLGTIAATKGTLAIEAPSIDASFGRCFGAGQTTLWALEGDITLGSAIRGGKYLYTFNGAYFASGDALTVTAKKDLNIKYGQISSVKDQGLRAEGKINNIAGDISGSADIYFLSPQFTNTRDSSYNQPIGDWTFAYTHCYNQLESSDQAVVRALGTIFFTVDNGSQIASSILGGKGIKFRPYTSPNKGLWCFSRANFEDKQPSTFTSTGRVLYGYGLHDKGRCYHQGCSPVSNCAATIMAGEKLEINLSSFSISGLTSSPWVAIDVSGSGFLGNGTRSRCDFAPTEPIVVNVTQFLQERARRPGFMRIDRRGAVENEFPMGCPFIPANGDVVLLQHPGQQPIRKFPINMAQFFNPICSIDLDLHIQQILAMRAGQVYAGEAKGNQLSKVLWHNAGQAKTARLGLMTEDELANSQRTMLLMQPTEDNTQVETMLVINPRDVNPFQSDGDLVTDKLDLKVGEDLTLENNRIVDLGEEKTVMEAGRDIHMRTTFHTNEYDVGKTHVVEQVADPQQMIFKPNGALKVNAGRDMNRTGSHVEAGGNVDLEAVRRLKEQELLMQKTATTKEEESTLLSSSERTETKLTHSALPTTTISGAKLSKKAGAGIDSTAPQDSAGDEIHYDSPDTVIEALIALNRHTLESSKSNGFTEQSTRMMQESAFGIPANLVAKKGVRFSGKAKVNANITTPTIHDETDTGIQFVAKVVEVLSSGQSLMDSPLCSVDAGFKAGHETMIPCMLMVEKIIRTKEGGQMLFESVLMDDKTEVIGAFVKTNYELKNWQTSWCNVSQAVPNEVIIAAALAITILTKGAGAKVLAPIIKGVTATTGMALSPIGITMVNAGYSAFCAAATSHFLRNGDPIHMAQQMTSLDQLKSIGISMAYAGLCDKLGHMLKINMAPGIKDLSMHLKEQALRASVDTVLNVAINKAPVDEALCDAVKQIPLKAVAAYAANQICLTLDHEMGVKAVHTLLGGLTGFAMEGNRDGVVAGATGSLTAQVVGDMLLTDAHAIADQAIERVNAEGMPMTGENIENAIQAEVAPRADLAKIAGGGMAALLKKDPNIALFTAGNAMDNDISIRQSIYVMAELQKLLKAAAMVEAAKRVEEKAEREAEIAAEKAKQQLAAKKARAAAAKKEQRRKEAEERLGMYLLEETRPKPPTDYQDVIFELAGEQVDVARKTSQPKVTVMAPGSDFNYPVTEEITQDDYNGRFRNHVAAARGIWRGVQDLRNMAVELVTEPYLYNHLIAPVGRLLWDVNVVSAGVNHRGGAPMVHWGAPESHAYYPDEATYPASEQRLFNVWHGIKESGRAFYNANLEDQIEAGFRMMTGLFAPGAVLKGASLLPRTFAAAEIASRSPVVQFASEDMQLTNFVTRTTNFQMRTPANKNRMPFVEGSALGPWQFVNCGYLKVAGLWEEATAIRNGKYYGNKDNALLHVIKASGSWTKGPAAPYVFLAHGNKEGVFLSKMQGYPKNKFPGLGDKGNSMVHIIQTEKADHRFIARLIESDPKFNKDNLVVLFSCYGGGPAMPQNLANKLGAAVIAPEEVSWALSDKKVAIAPILKVGGEEKADLTKLQAFRTYYPGNKPAPSHPSVLWTEPQLSTFEGSGFPLDTLSKKLAAMRNNPKGDWQAADLQYVAERYGISYRQNSTSHVTFSYPQMKNVIAPSRKPIKPVYIKQFLELLDHVIAQQAKK
jgi:hypothetical protein